MQQPIEIAGPFINRSLSSTPPGSGESLYDRMSKVFAMLYVHAIDQMLKGLLIEAELLKLLEELYFILEVLDKSAAWSTDQVYDDPFDVVAENGVNLPEINSNIYVDAAQATMAVVSQLQQRITDLTANLATVEQQQTTLVEQRQAVASDAINRLIEIDPDVAAAMTSSDFAAIAASAAENIEQERQNQAENLPNTETNESDAIPSNAEIAELATYAPFPVEEASEENHQWQQDVDNFEVHPVIDRSIRQAANQVYNRKVESEDFVERFMPAQWTKAVNHGSMQRVLAWMVGSLFAEQALSEQHANIHSELTLAQQSFQSTQQMGLAQWAVQAGFFSQRGSFNNGEVVSSQFSFQQTVVVGA